MSRSGYLDEYEHIDLYRASVDRAIHGARGQHFLRTLRAALDAMPSKRLITGAIRRGADVCALGAVDPHVKGYDADDLAPHFGIARSLAAEIVYQNDEWYGEDEPPEQRWVRMRAWVAAQIVVDEDETKADG